MAGAYNGLQQIPKIKKIYWQSYLRKILQKEEYVGESGNHMQHVARIGTEQGVGRVGRAAGFCAPFGLICVDPHGVQSEFRLVINLAVGTYHGVYAERA